MKTQTSVDIAAPAATVYALASATERWPEFLPHYRFVHVLERSKNEQIIEMAAWRDFIPITWTARQVNDATRPHIAFHHLRGWTRGMDVEWRFDPIEGGTRVTIEHRLRFRFPIASEWLGEHVVAGFFIDNVARKTLARMKTLAENAHD